jgi:hypothetical protein
LTELKTVLPNACLRARFRHGKPTSSSKATLIRPSCYATKARSATTPAVVTLALRATLVLQGSGATLNWTGGVPPYRVQRATDLTSGDWIDVLTNAVPPVTLTLERQAEFYRIIGQ